MPRTSELKLTIALIVAVQLGSAAAADPAQDWARMASIVPRGYVCYFATTAPQIDGRLDDAAWQAVPWTDRFVDIEGDRQPQPRFRTQVKMRWDDGHFYIAAQMEEPHVWGTLTKHDSVIFHDNDFEVFIDPDGDNHEYYELEINALNTTWDLFLPRPYKDGGRADNSWEMSGLKTAVHCRGTLNDPSDEDQGWDVELAIPWSALREFAHRPAPPRPGDQWRVNFSRVEWQHEIVAGKYQKIAKSRENNWVWSPQGIIDMHRPERWGYVQFSTDLPGTTQFASDPLRSGRDALMETYHRQKSFFQQHRRWASSLSELGIDPVTSRSLPKPLQMNSTATGFHATLEIPLADGATRRGHVSQDSRLRFTSSALAGDRHRVLVSTDIGGTDFDDFQSLVHLLLYADSFDIEGLISSPYGPGRKDHILKVIDYYERDYANLKSYSEKYPTSSALRAITKQGALESAGSAGFGVPTEGSEWIIQSARRDDLRPLYVLVWGGIDDLAQALHDAPDILSKVRVYFIGGPNKKWSVDAYNYIEQNHRKLWIIEANATYLGWFIGGNQSDDLSNVSFVAAHVAGHGALGEFFAKGISFDAKTRSAVKMGDTPSVAYLLHGQPDDPSQESWGGQFVRAWERPHKLFERLTTAADEIEQFGVLELALSVADRASGQPEARMQIENQSLKGFVDAQGALRFRFSPKEAKIYHYTIRANTSALDGKSGALTSVRPPVDAARRPSSLLPNWWTDDPVQPMAEGPHIGAKTVSRWRQEFLRDFASRLLRCKSPAPQ